MPTSSALDLPASVVVSAFDAITSRAIQAEIDAEKRRQGEPLPYTPENLDALRSRYEEALVPTYATDEILSGGVVPAQHRQHCFDFKDGLRLIVHVASEDGSRERAVIRVLAAPMTREYDQPSTPRLMFKDMRKRMSLLSGYTMMHWERHIDDRTNTPIAIYPLHEDQM